MKTYFFCVLFLGSAYFSNALFAQTQLDMNDEAQSQYIQADQELNKVYATILNDYKTDAEFIKNFKAAQKLWIQFRDAEMKAKYPDRSEGYYGSMHPLCWSHYLTELTLERTKKLKVWLVGTGAEGDPCAGSVIGK